MYDLLPRSRIIVLTNSTEPNCTMKNVRNNDIPGILRYGMSGVSTP